MKLTSRVGISKGTKQLAVIAVIGLFVYMAFTGGKPASTTPTQTTTQPGSVPGAYCKVDGGSNYCGDVTANVAHFDSLSISTARTEGTNVQTTWYTYRNGVYNAISTGNAKTFAVGQSDQGYVYALLQPVSGQNYYLDWQKTITANSPRIVTITFQDIVGLGVKNWVAKIKATDLSLTAGQTTANFYITAYWLTYSTMSINAPADNTNIGTTASTTSNILWTLSFTTNAGNVALAFYKVQVKVSTTNTAKFNLVTSTLTAFGSNIPLGNFVATTDGTNTYYDLVWGIDLDKAQYYTYPSSGTNNFASTLKLVLSLASGDSLTWTITYTPLQPSQSQGTTITDAVITSA